MNQTLIWSLASRVAKAIVDIERNGEVREESCASDDCNFGE